MNLYYIPEYNSTKKVHELLSIIHYSCLSFGDIIVFSEGLRVIMVVYNEKTSAVSRPSEMPMIAQVINRENSCSHILPILFEWDLLNERKGDLAGLNVLKSLFHKEKIASLIINSSIEMLSGRISRYDATLVKKVVSITQKVPQKEKIMSETQEIINNNDTSDKLMIVERYFTEKMKSDYYDMIELGYSERNALVSIKRTNPKAFSNLLKQFNKDFKGGNIYMKLL